jgi:hypothetical protein
MPTAIKNIVVEIDTYQQGIDRLFESDIYKR